MDSGDKGLDSPENVKELVTGPLGGMWLWRVVLMAMVGHRNAVMALLALVAVFAVAGIRLMRKGMMFVGI